MDSDNSKTLEELRAEVEELKGMNEQEKRNLAAYEHDLRVAQDRLAMTQGEKRKLDADFNELLGRLMLNSESGLAELVLKSIAQIENDLKKPDPVVEAKDKKIAELDKEFDETLGKLSGAALDEMLKRAQAEDASMKEKVREKQDGLQRLKETKANNRKEIARGKKERRQQINKLTEKYNGLHAQVMKKKYGGDESPSASQTFDNGSED